MKENKQNRGQFDWPEQSQSKEHGRKMLARLTSPRFIVGALAFLLVVISGLGSLVLTKNVYAKSECGILFLCPTPTPGQVASPTPTPDPISTPGQTPQPTPTPDQTPGPSDTPVPILVSSPTATASVSPTTSSTMVGQTPTPSPTSIPATKGGNAGDHTPNQLDKSGFSQIIAIVSVIFLCLLLGLGLGLFIFRRMLLPSIAVKMPQSGVSSSLSSLVPNADNLRGHNYAQGMQATLPSLPIFSLSDARMIPSDSGFSPVILTNEGLAGRRKAFDVTCSLSNEPENLEKGGNSLFWTKSD